MFFKRAAGALQRSQRLTVSAYGSAAKIRCLEKSRRGGWKAVKKLGDIKGFVGRNGITDNKIELDGYTPGGLFRLGGAFGIRQKPDTKMPYRQVTQDSWWVDDPKSAYYNQWVEAPCAYGWSSAEHLIDFPDDYAYAVIVEYNTAAVAPGKGSAIFLHCGAHSTSGCIAVKEEDLLNILKWLDPAGNPEILIESFTP